MRDTHWNPRFVQLSLDLAGRLLSARAACTALSVDRWPEAQLTLLSPEIYHPNAISSNIQGDNNLVTYQLLKHILATSIPLEEVFNTRFSAEQIHHQNWPQVQQYFSKPRSLIVTSHKPVTPPVCTNLMNPFALHPNPFLLPQPASCLLSPLSMPLLTTTTPTPALTGNLLTDLLALTMTPQLPWRLPVQPLVFPQTTGGASLGPLSPILPPLLSNDQSGKECFSHLQVVCFKDEAKTRFMCSKCSKQWTSMKGVITFLVIMSHQLSNVQVMHWVIRPGANVLLELFPQACGDCSGKGEAVICPPKWYPEEVDKVRSK
ncbi:unnamed protein product [Mesocestoides corti]|uniref:Zf-3CxxC domain-containing protein n=1 Tax=Mesocestoides corti TaxID=53468 RepID=A0A0R3UHE7_MESCO|nr:unnamed protein product [Mesocestoides corti]